MLYGFSASKNGFRLKTSPSRRGWVFPSFAHNHDFAQRKAGLVCRLSSALPYGRSRPVFPGCRQKWPGAARSDLARAAGREFRPPSPAERAGCPVCRAGGRPGVVPVRRPPPALRRASRCWLGLGAWLGGGLGLVPRLGAGLLLWWGFLTCAFFVYRRLAPLVPHGRRGLISGGGPAGVAARSIAYYVLYAKNNL